MAGVDHDQTEVLGGNEGVVRPFTDNQGVDSKRPRFT
jgi:hypothetical protein